LSIADAIYLGERSRPADERAHFHAERRDRAAVQPEADVKTSEKAHGLAAAAAARAHRHG